MMHNAPKEDTRTKLLAKSHATTSHRQVATKIQGAGCSKAPPYNLVLWFRNNGLILLLLTNLQSSTKACSKFRAFVGLICQTTIYNLKKPGTVRNQKENLNRKKNSQFPIVVFGKALHCKSLSERSSMPCPLTPKITERNDFTNNIK